MDWTESNGVHTAETEKATYEIWHEPSRKYVLRTKVKQEHRSAAGFIDMESGEYDDVATAKAGAESFERDG